MARDAVRAGVKEVVADVADALGLPADFNASNQFTAGRWATEVESCEAFDRIVNGCGLFTMVAEVQGEYVQPKILTAGSGRCRIDRILIPQPDLIRAGWSHGPIGVEIEKSGVKVGGPVSQALDYTRAVWHLKDPRPGFHLMLEWVAIFPMGTLYGDIASLAAQHRICGATAWQDELRFSCSSTCGLRVGAGRRVLDAKGFRCGARTGHRTRTS